MDWDKINSYMRKFADEKHLKDDNAYYTPPAVVELLSQMVEPSINNLLDPCCGSGSLLLRTSLYLKKQSQKSEIKLEGWDKDSSATQICKMNLILHRHKINNFNIERKSIEEWENEELKEKYECIVLNPPFGYTHSMKPGNRLENKFIIHAMKSLEENCNCIAIVPNGILGRTASEDISLRSTLTENYHLIRVILLPLSVFTSAEVYTSILVIKNSIESDKKTEIFDLRNCKSNKNLCEYYDESKPACILKKEDLQAHKYILLPEEYDRKSNIDINDLLNTQNKILKQLDKVRKESSPCLFEEKNGQINMFITNAAVLKRKQILKQILDLEYEFLSCELLIFCSKKVCSLYKGIQLFDLKGGNKCCDKKTKGSNIFYGAGGPHGTTPYNNMSSNNSIIIGRVGSCGNVYQAWTKGFLTDNAIMVIPKTEFVLPDFLLLLLRSAHYKKYQRGTGQPYITQENIYGKEFMLPALADQTNFLKQNEHTLQKIKKSEQELEELEVI